MELTKSHNQFLTLVVIGVCVAVVAAIAFLTTPAVEEGSRFYGTFWSLVPPIIAIILALITKNVYLSLFVGILIGAVFIGDGNLETTIVAMMDGSNDDGSWGFLGGLDTGILFFLVILGIIGCLLLLSGGSRAYGEWALKHIKTRAGAQIMTALLGVLIFIDDYFNCLTVGQVMRPVTDKFKISRAKLAYLIDSMAAPICIIAPISSWAAAVTTYMPEDANGFELFIESIFFNYYALFTIVMVIAIAVLDFDFGPMKVHEDNARNGDLFTTPDRPYDNEKEAEINPNGKVYDLLIPIFLFLVPACIIFLVWTGGFFDPESSYYNDFIGAMSDAGASTALAYGSLIALILTMIYVLSRRTVTFEKIMDCIPQGFKNMVPAISILVCAWAICGITRYGLGAPIFVDSLVSGSADALMSFLPAVFMLLACFISFSTGTSWGTFGILLPIVYAAFSESNPELMIVGISACLSGAVFGDHCSPISDTTIMSSAGAQCTHLNHVSTQVPYAMVVAAVSFVFFLIAGFWQSYIVTIIGLIAMVVVLYVLKKMSDNGKELFKKTA
jgi:Na+/H+ antiporter NhaC